MSEAKNDLDIFLEFLQCHKSALVIYGTGEAGRIICDCISNHMGYRIMHFIDRNIGGTCCGLPICGIETVSPDTGIIIAADPAYGIEKRLESIHLSNWIYMDPVFLNSYCRDENYIAKNKELIRKHLKDIARVKSLLCDQLSVKIFEEAITQRTKPNLRNINSFFDKGQYFGNDIIPQITGNIVDCGAFTGDTLARYLQQAARNDWKYYAFEGDASNCKEIRRFADDNGISERVSVFNLAVWNKETVLTFDNPTGTNEMTSGRVNREQEDGIKVNAARLDHILLTIDGTTNRVDLITMDIEGAEPNALLGAREIIETYHPALAISIYHETEHLWKIPLMIHEMDQNYRLYIRHHRWNIADTVCYAIRSGR